MFLFLVLISLVLRPWQTRTHCCGHIVARRSPRNISDVSWAAQTGKHLLRTQNVSEQNQKHFLCPGHNISVRNKCCARGQTGKHLCRQQCVLVCQGLYAHKCGPGFSVPFRLIILISSNH